MIILEHEAKALLRQQGLLIPVGQVVKSASEAAQVAEAIGKPVVIKAQVPTGGRMKAGGIRFADTPDDAESAAVDMLGMTIGHFSVDTLLIEEKLEIATEVYIATTYDSSTRTMVLIASAEGGIEIESAGRFVRRALSSLMPVSDYVGRETAAELGFKGAKLPGLAAVITQVAQCFRAWDALLLELNPVVLDVQGKWWAADVHLELDDDAAYRQADLLHHGVSHSMEMANRKTEFERRAVEIDSADHRGVAGRLVPFDGDLGLLIGGGGASLTILDAVFDAGLKPANYCEIGGNPSVWKIKELTKLILSQPQVTRLAVIMNVVSNTRVDLVARGVIKGILELGRNPAEVIAAFRIPGSWEDEGQAILNHYGVPFFGRETSIDQVVEAIR
jgi:succinyl-CoA synthetase beta subunit/citryl-CoA synthetase large subunit